MLPDSIGARPGSSRAPMSSSVTIVPRTLINPRTYGGAPGRRLAGRRGWISWASPMSQPYTVEPTRNSSVGVAVGSSVGAVESKEVERIDVDQRYVWAG